MTLANHAALQRELTRVEARLKALDAPTPDSHGDDADRLVAREEHEGQVLGRASLLERQHEILAALLKIDMGVYGVCERCLGPIAAKRLDAMPWAPRCLACQSVLEIEDTRFRRAAGLAMTSAQHLDYDR